MKKEAKIIKKEKKLYFLPKTKLGKYSFWLVLIGLVLMYLQYWFAMIFKTSVPAPIGLLSIFLMVIFGITSIISIIRYKDRAISLFISSLLGILGILMILGEILVPH